MTTRFPKLTAAVLDVLTNSNPPRTARGIVGEVQKRFPLATHQSVTAELGALMGEGKVEELREPHLPARYRLTPRKPTPPPDEEQLTLRL